MGLESVVAIVLVGALAGWLAGKLVEGYGFGLVGNIAIGIAGAFLARLILPQVGLGTADGFFSAILHSTFGAVILLWIIRLVRRT